MAVESVPKVKLYAVRGADFEQLIAFSAVTADNRDDWTPRMVMRRQQSDASTAFASIDGVWTDDDPNAPGQQVASFSQSANVTAGWPRGGGHYYVDLIGPGGEVNRQLSGALATED